MFNGHLGLAMLAIAQALARDSPLSISGSKETEH